MFLAHYASHPLYGFNNANRRIEDLYDERRERCFKEIPESDWQGPREAVDEEDSEVCIYAPARWRIRVGVIGEDAYRDCVQKVLSAMGQRLISVYHNAHQALVQ